MASVDGVISRDMALLPSADQRGAVTAPSLVDNSTSKQSQHKHDRHEQTTLDDVRAMAREMEKHGAR